MKPENFQLVQALKTIDLTTRNDFCSKFKARITDDDRPARFLFLVMSNIWETENPHVSLGHGRDSPNVYALDASSKQRFYVTFCFVESRHG